MFTHSFRDTYPPARFDALPWTRVLVEQSADGLTAWTQISDQAIATDATPDSPNAIDITVATATLERAWFRFRFEDAAAALSPYTTATLSPSANPLTLEGLKRRLDKELTADDDKLQEYLDSAFMQAQAPPPLGCGRLLVPDPLSDSDTEVTRTVPAWSRIVQIPDAREITAITVDGATLAAADYDVTVADGMTVLLWIGRTAWGTGVNGRLARTVTITGRFGFTAIPSNLADAIYVLAARYHYEEAAQYADQVAVLEGTAVNSYFRQLPPRTKMVFATYAVDVRVA